MGGLAQAVQDLLRLPPLVSRSSMASSSGVRFSFSARPLPAVFFITVIISLYTPRSLARSKPPWRVKTGRLSGNPLAVRRSWIWDPVGPMPTPQTAAI